MAPIAPGRRLRQEEPDSGAAGGDARVPVMGAIAKQGSAPPAMRAAARAGRSFVLRLRRNGAHPAPHPSDRSGTAVGLLRPPTMKVRWSAPAGQRPWYPPQEAPCLA